jgi:hypothetical protein
MDEVKRVRLGASNISGAGGRFADWVRMKYPNVTKASRSDLFANPVKLIPAYLEVRRRIALVTAEE